MLTAKELEFFRQKSFGSFEDAILGSAMLKREGGCVSTSARLLKVEQIVEMVLNPGRSLEDTPARIAALEEDLMGIPLSCSYMDACLAAGTADATCRDFKRGRTGRMSLNVRIKEVKEHVLKDDAKMAFVTAEDDSGELDNIVLFKDEYKKFGGLLYPGAFVALFGEKSKTKNSLVISRVVEL
jgi:DNA polymerase III alpha subunit